MELNNHSHSQQNPFDLNFYPVHGDQQHYNGPHERCPMIPVQIRLKENKQRRLIIEKEKQREKQFVLNKRKEKQQNVQKVLKQKQEARENAKYIFGNMQKTFMDKFHDQGWKKSEDIEQKIHECRSRADQYRTMYQKKIHDTRQDRQQSVKFRRNMREQEENDRSLNHHLAEWRSYQKKIVQKYKGQIKNPHRMCQDMAKRQEQLRGMIQKHKLDSSQQRNTDQSLQSLSYKPINIKNRQQQQQDEKPSLIERDNPVYVVHELSSFGLSKSIRNPEKMLKQLKQFIQDHKMIGDVPKDEQLINKFQAHLQSNYGQA